MSETIAIYPGTFDPPTNGHIDIIKRGAELFDKVIIVIASNPAKKHLFSIRERGVMFEEILHSDDLMPYNIEIDSDDGLMIDYANRVGAKVILRGLRAVSDFEYEFQLAMMNRKLERNIQSVFLISGLQWIYTSSSIVKQAASFHADVSDLVHPYVDTMLMEKYE